MVGFQDKGCVLVRKTISFALLCLVASVLSACGGGAYDTKVVMNRDESWQADVVVTISKDEVELVGGPQALDSQIQTNMVQLRSTANDLGVRYSDSKRENSDGSIVYSFSLSGSGYNALNRLVFGGAATLTRTVQDGDVHISFRYSPMFTGARFFRLQLRAGKVLSSNADQINGNTQIWANLMETGYAGAEILQPTVHPTLGHTLTTYGEERWRVDIVWEVSRDEVSAYDNRSEVDAIVREIQQPMLDRLQVLGLSSKKEIQIDQDGSTRYSVTVYGHSSGALNQLLFQGAADIQWVSDQEGDRIQFRYAPTSQSELPHKLEIRGEQIIESNASILEEGIASWQNLRPGMVAEALLSPAIVLPDMEHTIELYATGRWQAQVILSVGAEEVDAIGGEAEVSRQIEKLQQPIIERFPSSNQQPQQNHEIKANGAVAYSLTFRGQGLDVLNQVVFGGFAVLEPIEGSGSSRIRVIYEPKHTGIAHYTLNLKGAKVVSTNGRYGSDGRITWEDLTPGSQAEAVIIPISSPNRAWLLIGVLGLGGVGIVAFFVVRRRTRSLRPSSA